LAKTDPNLEKRGFDFCHKILRGMVEDSLFIKIGNFRCHFLTYAKNLPEIPFLTLNTLGENPK